MEKLNDQNESPITVQSEEGLIAEVRTESSWQLHAFFRQRYDNGGLYYGLVNLVAGVDHVYTYALVPVDSDINFKHLLDLVNMFDFRVKKLSGFVAAEQKRNAVNLIKDFPDVAEREKMCMHNKRSEFISIVRCMTSAIQAVDVAKLGSEGAFEVLRAALIEQGILLINKDYILTVLKQMALRDGFVFVQPQAVNKKTILEFLLRAEVSIFLMTRSSPPTGCVYDMIKLCSKTHT